MVRGGRLRVRVFVVVLWLVVLWAVGVPGGAWAAGTVGWTVHVVAEPSSFNASDQALCEGGEEKCDRYQLLVLNTGDKASSGPITVTDHLPTGITARAVSKRQQSGYFNENTGTRWHCELLEGETVVSCTAPESGENPDNPEEIVSVPAGHYAPFIDVIVSAPAGGLSGVLRNEVTVEGGGAPAAASAVLGTMIGKSLAFEVGEFAFEPQVPGGAPAAVAGVHPWTLTASLGVPSGYTPPHGGQAGEGLFAPARNMRSIAVELPAGLAGNPLTTEHCEEAQLRLHECPRGSKVGVVGILDGKAAYGEFASSEDTSETVTVVYNMVPEAGYPVELGFAFAKTVPVLLFPDVVDTGSGYRLRVTTPGVPSTLETVGFTTTLFGEPGRLNGSGSEAAFLDSPSDCAAEAEGLSGGAVGTARVFSSRLEVEPWGEPGRVVTSESGVYSGLSGCAGLAGLFSPGVGLGPAPVEGGAGVGEGSLVKDVPSGYSFALKVPQTSAFSEPSTPDVRDVKVQLPGGVTADPSSATGLVGCQATGPEGVNVGSGDVGVHGEDLGDPEATELGEGHEGGDSSPYDDGFYHTAPGHCPSGSVLGSVEVCTPLLANRANKEGVKTEGVQACEEKPGIAPLQGAMYLAEPKCGGEGQPACKESSNPSEDSAENGELFSGYIEVSGSGVIVKLPGTISADPGSDQLTGTFKESPQFPFSEFRLHIKGGARAPIANPQLCGSYTTDSTLSSWAGQEVSLASQPFTITGCASGNMPFGPSLAAATGSSVPGGDTPFALSFSRQDGEQDFSGLSETMPAGLLGKIAGVPLCPEAAANAGTCATVAPGSEIGSTSVLVGPGPEPYSVTGGRVYLTGPYHGAPFGLSIVVPAKAGPFNLGNEVIRAAIHINPSTTQVTVTTNQLPQSKDGVQLRLRAVATEINKPGFLRNPTSCSPQNVATTITAAQGATANLTAPLAPTNCASLPFAPKFEEITSAKTSKANGASLTVKITQKPGEADIAKTDVQLPVSLPSRLTTLQKACTEAQFNTNPAGCPEGSDIGTATANTPLLANPATGPAYLVSHGSAAFPDVEFVLQDENITIILDGKTDIKKGITYSNFETVPDVPITSFTASLPEGPHSALTAYGSLCTPTETITVKKHITRHVKGHTRHTTITTKKTVPKPLTSPTTLTAQNGATIKQTTHITVTGCPKPKPTTKPHTKNTKPKHKPTTK